MKQKDKKKKKCYLLCHPGQIWSRRLRVDQSSFLFVVSLGSVDLDGEQTQQDLSELVEWWTVRVAKCIHQLDTQFDLSELVGWWIKRVEQCIYKYME